MELDARLTILQPIVAVLLIVVSLIGSIIPYTVMKAKQFTAIMSYLNCCAGGVLSGVALLHIIPDAGVFINPALNNFPISFCIIFVGMIVMTLIIKLGDANATETAEPLVAPHDAESASTHEVSSEVKLCLPPAQKQQSKNSYVMLFIGLIIHDLSEGIMLGLQTNYDHVIYLSLALILHKWCESCCQIVTGIRRGVYKKHNIMTSVGLSLASPVAQITAFVIMLITNKTEISDSLYIAQGVFMSFAAGTFLTIILIEIINDELDNKTKPYIVYRILTAIGGFIFISCCSIVEYTIE